MRRAEVVATVLDAITNELVVTCNGMIGREAFTAKDREATFYMIGSMGLALSIGLGVATCRPEKRVVVIDGDGNLLMGAAVLGSVAAAKPKNLIHVVLDNESHGSTGGQTTISNQVDLSALARAAGYVWAERVEAEDLAAQLPFILAGEGPAMVLVKVERGNLPGIGRVSHTPPEITARFAKAAQASA